MESEYWHGTKEVRTISKEGEAVHREVTQNFRSSKILQKVILHLRSSIEFHYLQGPVEGLKVLSIELLGPHRQLLTARWDIRITGLLKLLSPGVRGHISKGTVDALERIRRSCAADRETAQTRSIVGASQ